MLSEARQKWLEDRKKSIGASEAPGVLGISPWSSPLTIWAQKLGIVEADEEETERMRWGHLLEPVILAEYAERRGIEVDHHDQTQVIRHPDFPAVPMACTPDGRQGKRRLVQVKTTSAFNVQSWSEGIPLDVQVQMQAEMAVTNTEENTAVVLIGGQRLEWYDLERNDAFISSLEDKLTTWWNHYVIGNIEPPADGSDACIKYLERLHPEDSGDEIALPGDFVPIDERLVEVKAEMKALVAERKELENKIKAVLGAATFGKLPGGGRYSWKTQNRKEFVTKASQFRILRRHAK